MTHNQIRVDLVDTDAGFALLESGEICEITNLFDEFGDEIDITDPDDDDMEPVTAVIRLPDKRWATLFLENIPEQTIN